MSRLLRMAFVSLALAAAASASAQELNLATASTDRPSIVSVRTGMDHALVGEIGYRHVLAWGDHPFFVGGDVAMPWAKADAGEYRVRATLGVPFGGEHWKVAGWLSPTLRGTENAASDMAAVGVDLRLTGGYYARRWFLAGEAGIDWVAATHITFSDAYRDMYSGARNGWYGNPGGTTYAGLNAGVSFRSVDVIVRAGVPRTTELEQQTVPLYVTAGVNVTLPR
jgi:hypothetical protein